MEVILSQDVQKIGKSGTIAKVKDGFARNFLIPKRLAVPVTPASLKRLEQEKQKRLSETQDIKRRAEELKNKLAGLSLTIASLIQGEEELLYGSITTQDIAAALKEEGYEIDKSRVLLSEPIKALGIYEVPIDLHPEVSAKIKLWVVKK